MTDIYGTGRVESPFRSPDGKAHALYHDGITTLWFYPGANAVVIQTNAPEEHRPAIKKAIQEKLRAAVKTSESIIERAEEAIRQSNATITHATKAIAQNQNDVIALNVGLLELDRQWPEEDSGWK